MIDGLQYPRIRSVPPFTASTADEALELVATAGLKPDPWQGMVLRDSLGEVNKKWAAREVALILPRQSGKDEVCIYREIAGLYLLGERLIISSAHEFATSLESFRRLLEVIEGTPDFSRRVRKVTKTHGAEGVELDTGQRITFRTRTATGARGFTADLVICNEAMVLSEDAHSTLVPTQSARPNPQTWYRRARSIKRLTSTARCSHASVIAVSKATRVCASLSGPWLPLALLG
jgi:hypothetical protein